MIIEILDDFSLEKISSSGQCFRVRHFDNGLYRFITGSNVLYIKNIDEQHFDINCSEFIWNNIWHPYFDLSNNYKLIRSQIDTSDSFLRSASEFGKGIRILNQDPWETLVTFIISQRKSIPAIKECIELLANTYGPVISTPYESLHFFPSSKALINVTESDLRRCKLGYRAKYVLDAIHKVNNNDVNLSQLSSLDNEHLLSSLCTIKGVGTKVSNCVGLFSYGRTSLAPIDTWIQKIIIGVYNGQNPFNNYPQAAGIMQQYLFYYAISNKEAI